MTWRVRLWKVLRLGARVAFLSVAAFLLWLLAVWPPPVWYRSHWPRETPFMAMRHDDTVRRYVPVTLDKISPPVARAVIVAEDQRFREHGGIDYSAMLDAVGYRRREFRWKDPRDRRELWRALRKVAESPSDLRGASTITQQLAKNLYLSSSRNPMRKVKEGVLAWRLERALGKERILELYLNVAELGSGIWGVEAASQAYFNRSVKNLGARDAAALAATLPHPRTSNPAHRPGRMRWRQNLILGRLGGE